MNQKHQNQMSSSSSWTKCVRMHCQLTEVMISSDTNDGYDGKYGDITLKNAYSPVPSCVPARAALLTGIGPRTLQEAVGYER